MGGPFRKEEGAVKRGRPRNCWGPYSVWRQRDAAVKGEVQVRAGQLELALVFLRIRCECVVMGTELEKPHHFTQLQTHRWCTFPIVTQVAARRPVHTCAVTHTPVGMCANTHMRVVQTQWYTNICVRQGPCVMGKGPVVGV